MQRLEADEAEWDKLFNAIPRRWPGFARHGLSSPLMMHQPAELLDETRL